MFNILLLAVPDFFNAKPDPFPDIAELLFALPAETAFSAAPGPKNSHRFSLLETGDI